MSRNGRWTTAGAALVLGLTAGIAAAQTELQGVATAEAEAHRGQAIGVDAIQATQVVEGPIQVGTHLVLRRAQP